jgi:hypothetical protein
MRTSCSADDGSPVGSAAASEGCHRGAEPGGAPSSQTDRGCGYPGRYLRPGLLPDPPKTIRTLFKESEVTCSQNNFVFISLYFIQEKLFFL